MKSLLQQRETVLALIIVAMGVAVSFWAPNFLAVKNFVDIATDTSFLTMMALAQMTVILTRGIDLSVASTLACSGMAAALIGKADLALPALLLVFIGIAVGGVLGMLNGLLVAALGIPPIVVTLGTMLVFRGLTFMIAQGKWVHDYEMSSSFLALPNVPILGVPMLVWIALIVIALFYVFLSYTRTGRMLYAVGGNPLAARYVGISVARQQFIVYAISGAVAGLCGVLWVSHFGTATPDGAVSFELQVVAACVIGGVSVAGGVGTVAGAVLGTLFLGVIENALSLINGSSHWQMAIAGLAIVTAVIINARSERTVGKLILPEARRAALKGSAR